MKYFILFILLVYSFYSYSQDYQTDTLRIYYPIDITNLNDAAKKSLDSLGSLVKRNKKASLAIIGFADYLGTNPHNVDLSVSRAQKVKVYLHNQGLDTLQIKTCEGKGALQAGEIKSNKKGIPQHRKVEIIITWPIKKKAAVKKSPPQFTPEKEAPPVNIKDLKKGDKFTLRNLNFEGGRHYLVNESYRVLQELTDIMKNYPTLKIEIQGHICCDSVIIDGYDNDTRTNDLSFQRAKVVYEHLKYMGIDTTRMVYKGYGGKFRLIKDERTDLDRKLNRRVEIKILEK